MSLIKIRKFFSISRIFPESISTNEKFLFELRNKLINKRTLSESESRRLFTARKYFANDIFLGGIKNHVLEFNNFKNKILMKIFGFDKRKNGISLLNLLVNRLF